jgi:hypothetical protein
MSVIHKAGGRASEAVDEKALHPQLRSTRIAHRRWGSVDSSTIHSTYYYY